jgi:alpha-tubulin suppressor-like RCC1 family protein
MKKWIGTGKGIRPRVIVFVTLVNFILWLYPFTFSVRNILVGAPQIPILLLPLGLFLLHSDVRKSKRISIWDSILALSYLGLNTLASLTWGGRATELFANSEDAGPLLVKLLGADSGNFIVALFRPINASFIIIWFICVVIAVWELISARLAAKQAKILAETEQEHSDATRNHPKTKGEHSKVARDFSNPTRDLAETEQEHSGHVLDGRFVWFRHAAIPMTVLILVVVLSMTLFFRYDKAPALADRGQIWAFGDAYPLAEYENALRLVPYISDATAVSASNMQVHALAEDGTVWTFGGELKIEPRKVPILSDIIELQTYNDTVYALRRDGVLYAWGDNYHGDLGDGTLLDRDTPVTVSAITGVEHVWAGDDVAFALTSDGKLWGWGWNAYGQVSTESDEESVTEPVLQVGIEKVKAVVAPSSVPYALTEDGKIYRWTRTDWGDESDGKPKLLTGIPPMVSLFGGTEVRFIFAIDEDGQLWAWEDNMANEEPLLVEGLPKIAAVATADSNLYALAQDGSVWQFFDDGSKEGSKARMPEKITGLSDIVSIACSASGLYAVQGA